MNVETFENELYNLLLQHLEEKYDIDKYIELLEVEPHNSLLMYVLSHAYFKIGNEDKAKEYYNKAVKQNSNIDFDKNYENIFVIIYYIFCTITTHYNPFCDDEIEEEIKKSTNALELEDAGRKYRDIGDLSNANRVADMLLEKYPNDIGGLLIKSAINYSRRINDGWKYFDLKSAIIKKDLPQNIKKPIFELQKDYARVYIYACQGFGDGIYYSRWLKKLKTDYPKLKLTTYVTKNLEKLFTDNDINVITTIPSNNRKDFDYCIAIDSLPSLFKNEEGIPYKNGYLMANKDLSAEFKTKYFNTPKKKIGIVWNSSQEGDTRNLSLENFTDLFNIKEYQFYSLQLKTELTEQLIMAKNGVVSLGEKIDDFATTAALIDNMDLIIGCDTSVTNLSGALGKKTFVILPIANDFRWGVFEQYVPCFESVEAFRQKKDYDYSECIDRIKQRLVAGDF